MLASGDWAGSITVWSTRTGKTIRSIDAHGPPVGGVHSLFFLPGDRRLISGGEDGIVACWDLRSGRLMWRRRLGRWLWEVALSPDATRLAGATGRHGAVLCTMDGRGPLRPLLGSGNVYCVAFCRGGSAVFTGSRRTRGAVWSVRTGRRLHLLPRPQGALHCSAASVDGRFLAIGDDRGVTVRTTDRWTVTARWLPPSGRPGLIVPWTDGHWLMDAGDAGGFGIWRVERAGRSR
jgi:WD40 repeat protein